MSVQTQTANSYADKIAKELQLSFRGVAATLALFEEGCTIPFIARYRKEATGSLDELAILKIRERHEQLSELDKRREAICKSLDERQLLSDELKSRVNSAATMAEL